LSRGIFTSERTIRFVFTEAIVVISKNLPQRNECVEAAAGNSRLVATQIGVNS
jgi:hypothetical protein